MNKSQFAPPARSGVAALDSEGDARASVQLKSTHIIQLGTQDLVPVTPARQHPPTPRDGHSRRPSTTSRASALELDVDTGLSFQPRECAVCMEEMPACPALSCSCVCCTVGCARTCSFVTVFRT